ncbi:putative fha domain-containing protein [Erysiphe neolycopersici]|uniref:Putative fha domain-containing protein n=1 Tax=Erysiphe neolycopersici TaxID=212602 RepID=A0A420I4D4_9PEZI|nr:putative fha domain-containing protein [Erysiphe neolycopersici]
MSTSSLDNTTWASTGAKKKTPKPAPWLNRRSNSISNFKVPSTRPSGEFAPNELIVRSPGSAPSSQRSQSISSINSSQKSSGNRSQSQIIASKPPVLCLVSMNGTFARKEISVPLYPESVRIGRQTNTKTAPTPSNGYFDSKVLSRQHAELWSDKSGIIWIKDIKSSNGTFVNGARLSPENQESEPHELETHDQLDLGIDIVSEDQKTVVHHKVAAKVEYAGHAETVQSIEFDNSDSTACTNIGLPQGQVQIRGRNEPHQPNGNGKRSGTTVDITNSLISLGQQRQMKFWITPITVEQIVKRLTNEMRMARLQTSELKKTHDFLGSLLDISKVEHADKSIINEALKPTAYLNNIIRQEPTTCFSAPPAPPPQQPLPEKPDFARSTDHQSQTSYSKRENIERSTSSSGNSQACPETPGQAKSLMKALALAKKEIDSQTEKMRELEAQLLKEKKTREYAEYVARQLESQSETRRNELLTVSLEQPVIEEAFKPHINVSSQKINSKPEVISEASKIKTESQSDNESSNSMENCLETIFAEMGEPEGQLETCKACTEAVMADRDADQKTLAEMVEKIRLDEAERNKQFPDELGCCGRISEESSIQEGKYATININLQEPIQQEFQPNFKSQIPWNNEAESTILAKNNNYCEPFLNHHAAPFASMLGVVLIGVGIMSYLNGWHVIKGER